MASASTSKWNAGVVRKTFCDFFEKENGHTFVPSSSVVPYEDNTLLFVNSGMVQVGRVYLPRRKLDANYCVLQYKPIFLGIAEPNSEFGKLKRAVNSQKCIRAGGKHNGESYYTDRLLLLKFLIVA